MNFLNSQRTQSDCLSDTSRRKHRSEHLKYRAVCAEHKIGCAYEFVLPSAYGPICFILDEHSG